jgi:hypothetical protein
MALLINFAVWGMIIWAALELTNWLFYAAR